ncbi:MAG: MarR family transcriptional regulator [Sphingobacteriia bacterium 24-36-13]|jgi:DNA-binding MarR family transcriptional regulator|uniref:MarR family winged helix-turn-helix transcriptional regulator n=1 Tax=Sediminibacterium sp. TaxID=1917865 RepID=UPI000BC7B6BC|nr:MarR family winged helix-turn-helix transcriptional regulator [Sediminibacterium sp.]OYY10576.1 MAG: MarR family transcriptional regulator [Sphingobacteriia bacterium 35-36-14]OYZ52107.1 MAG: MarR family transcriptional regulator [Sphingobacteriia bacterium 24-36-13]OZA63267.1 MAG: MarR family transcriptional regulator [Sphingobacteriia bacterium 39-36-14]HQS25296.1 MarR family winged helix-turn-helix transcriptional regulator [Sediminibacterium sp.]HQS35795.1 MarR family winged helix-turn-
MKYSSFNLSEQNQKVESRIVVALERISEAFRVLLWNESKENSLSPIQIQILIFIYFHSQEKCKVGYLADEFNMTKATISDSVKVLLAKDLVAKEINTTDTRSYSISLTPEGKQIAKKASFFASSIEQPLEKLTEEQKTVMLNGLLKLIYDLNKSGIITIQRMCFTCANYQVDKGVHYCKLLKSRLAENELRVDCPEHELQL